MILRGLRSAAPALAVAAVVTVTLVLTGTAKTDIVRYAAYLCWGVLLPGTLVHRALRGRRVRLSEDLAAGVVVGMCLELGVFVLLVVLRAQWLLPWWPLAVVIPMLAVPRLRKNWRWGGERGWTPLQAWALAGVTTAVILWVAYAQWMNVPILSSLSWWPRGADDIFHLAIAGELRNHIPPIASWVLGEPLDYHWFHHASLAASSDISGVELRVVLLRLCLLPLIPAMVLLTAAAATRLSGKGWAGPAAAGLAFTVTNLPPVGQRFGEAGPFTISLYYSPGQTFATAVQALALLLLVDLLRRNPRHVGTWVLLAVTVVVMAGSKSTFLPVLGAGVGLAFAIQLLRRRIDRVLLTLGVLVSVVAAGAVVVLFRGAAHGLAVDPLATVQRTSAAKGALGATGDLSSTALLALTVLAVVAWCIRLSGAVVALRRRWDDPVVGVLAGSMIAAVAGMLLTVHPGNSQFYFIRGAMPLGAILTVWGVAIALERVADRRRTIVLAFAAVAVGFGVATAVVSYLHLTAAHGDALIGQFALVFGLTIGGCILGAALLAFLPGTRSRGRAAAALALVAIGAAGLQPLAVEGRQAIVQASQHGMTHGWHGHPKTMALTPWNIEAARWLRDHSSPDDVVATNVHCRAVREGRCDNRMFMVAAFTERRVLVEGWAFTPHANEDLMRTFKPYEIQRYVSPFWDPARLAANDLAITDPTPERLDGLRDRWGVRWLFVSYRGGDAPGARLGEFADLRYKNREAWVYELRRAPATGSTRATR